MQSAALAVVINMWSNQLRRSSEQIREDMLKLTPIGTSMDDVLEVITNNQKWKIRYIREWVGFRMTGGRPSEGVPDSNNNVGVKSIRVYLGQYGIIFATGVSVFYGFDEDSKLIEIGVKKETDSL